MEVSGTCSTYGRDVKCMQNFSGKVTRQEVIRKTVGWNQLLQDFFCWRNFVDAVTNLRVVRIEILTTISVQLVVIWSVTTCIVLWVDAKVSEEHAASIIRAEVTLKREEHAASIFRVVVTTFRVTATLNMET
jgi:hypothetical protein